MRKQKENRKTTGCLCDFFLVFMPEGSLELPLVRQKARDLNRRTEVNGEQTTSLVHKQYSFAKIERLNIILVSKTRRFRC